LKIHRLFRYIGSPVNPAISQSIVPSRMRQLQPEEGFLALPSTAFLLNRNPDSGNCVVDSHAEYIKRAFTIGMNL
jgi:hypothetical protein